MRIIISTRDCEIINKVDLPWWNRSEAFQFENPSCSAEIRTSVLIPFETFQTTDEESWVQQMLGDQLECTELLANSFNTFLAGLTADFVPLPQIIPGSFFRSLNTCWLTHIWYTRPWEALNRTSQGGLIPSRGKSGKSLVLYFHQSSQISIMPWWYKDTSLCFLSNPKLSLFQNVRHPK